MQSIDAAEMPEIMEWVEVKMRHWRTMLFATAFCALPYSSVVAKNLKAIAEFVIPAYTAMNFTTLSAQDDPRFLADSRGPRGHAIKYAEHVKVESISSQSESDSVIVLRIAADEAQSITRAEFRKVIPNRFYRYPEIADWCRGDALRFVRSFIEQHDTEHTVLLLRLEDAKQ